VGIIKHLPCYIAGERIDLIPGEHTGAITSIDQKVQVPVVTTTPAQLRKALRFAEKSQKILERTPMEERVRVARLVMSTYKQYEAQVRWGLANFRGIVAKDSFWMCKLLDNWSQQLETFVSSVWQLNPDFSRTISFKDEMSADLTYRSKGFGTFFCASTMDGPPAIAALCHGILSGTHLIVRPSWRDTATHFMFDILLQHGLGHYAQLVRWPSDAPESKVLNQQLITNVQQAIIFCSDETFQDLVEDSGLKTVSAVNSKMKKYGTGLPLVIVTPNTDLKHAAALIVEGARLGNGKFCLSHGPVLVQREAYPAFIQEVVACAKNLKPGDLLDLTTEAGGWDSEELATLKRQLASFGGTVAYGEINEKKMDMMILKDIPSSSPCLFREFSGTYVGLIPYDTLQDAVTIAQSSLAHNNREAWTAVNFFGSNDELKEYSQAISSYYFLRGGITAIPRFLMPHQGSYFALDLMRRQSDENLMVEVATLKSPLKK
jgi:hypothetical protein